MRVPASHLSLLLVLFLVVFVFHGCSPTEEESTEPDQELRCGTGTVLQEGFCVLSPVSCPDGQVALPTGQCRSPDIFCGSDTVYDVTVDGCLPASTVRCGAGTVESNGRCVVEDQKSCGQGTVLASGQCVLHSSVCGSGTILDEARCVPGAGACGSNTQFDVVTGECVDLFSVSCGEDTILDANQCRPLVSFLDELAANADLDFADTNKTITPGAAIGDQVVFTGTMNTQNLFHVFPVVGNEGTWVQVTLYSRGLPSPGFRVRQTFGNWIKESLPGLASSPTRKIVFPQTGNYDLIIESSLSTAAGGPFQNAGFAYVGIVETIAAPSARYWDVFQEPLGGQLDQIQENLIEIHLAEGQQAIITPTNLGVDHFEAHVEVWKSPTEYSHRTPLREGEALTIERVSSSPSVFLLIDARRILGPRTTFEATARASLTLLPGALVTDQIFAEAGQVLRISHFNEQARALSAQIVFDNQTVWIKENLLAQNKTSFVWPEKRRDFFYAPHTGVYEIEVRNQGTSSVTGFYTTHSVQTPEVISYSGPDSLEIATTLAMQNARQGDWRYLILDVADTTFVEASISGTPGYPYIRVYDGAQNILLQNNTFSTSKALSFDLPGVGPYVVGITSGSNFTLLNNVVIDLTLSPVDSLLPGESIEEIFDVSLFDIFQGSFSYRSGSSPVIRLNNPDQVPLVNQPIPAAGLDLLQVLPASGEYLLEIINDSSAPTIDLQSSFQLHSPQLFLDVLGLFEEEILSENTLEADESEFYLMRARAKLNHFIRLNPAGDAADQEATLRLYRVEDGTIIASNTGSEEVSIASSNLDKGLYLLEVKAQTDLSEGYSLTWTGNVSNLTEATVTNIGVVGGGFGNPLSFAAQLDFGSCPQVANLEVDLDIHTGQLWKTDLDVFLTSPGGTTVEFFRDPSPGSFTSGLLSYPEPIAPLQSFAPFIGASGTGTWTLDIEYRGFASESATIDWTLRLDCPN